MPGISGIIGIGNTAENENHLRKMNAHMMHESFYTSGQLVNERLKSWLGWVNIKNSFSDCNPIWNENRDVCMIFCGEDHTDSDQITKLKIEGHEFGLGNASYLVHYYEDLGADFFPKLNGSFCGVILDYRNSSVTLFNDRYGLNRLYYREKDGSLYFSSEAKSLLAILPELRRIDFRSLAETFLFNCVLQNRTLYAGLSLIPGGSVWTFQRGSAPKKKTYFNPKQLECAEPLSNSEYYEKLKQTWIRVLPRYLCASEQVAFSLTGGKDSRMILSWAQAAPGALPCYTFGGTYRDCLDVKIGRRVAAICHQPYYVLKLDETFFKDFSSYAAKTVYLTDGNMDVSGSPGLLLNSRSREIAPIRLTGNFGQEILHSAVAFMPARLLSRILQKDFFRLVEEASQVYYDEKSGNRLSFVAFKQIPWYHYSRLACESSQITLRSPYLDNEILGLAYQAPTGLGKRDNIQLRLIAEGNSELGKIETDRGLLFKPVPLYTWLNIQFQNFMFKADYAFGFGMPHSLAKIDNRLRVLKLERLFLGRHKYNHFRIWYRDKLSSYIRDILLDSRTKSRPFLNGSNIEGTVTAHIKGTCNYTSEIHWLLTVELIYRKIIESHG